MKRSVFWFLFGCLFACAIFFRFYKLGSIPISLYWDETAILADARSVAATGKDMHGHSAIQAIFPSYGDYKLPVYIWLASVAVKLFGNTEWAVRLPSAVAGLLTVLIGGVLAVQLNKKTGHIFSDKKLILFTTLVITTSFWSIMFSRTGFEGHVAQMLVGLSIVCVFLSRKNLGWLLVSALIGTVAVYTYYSVRFVWPVVFLAACFVVYAQNYQSFQDFRIHFLKAKKKTIFFWATSAVAFVSFFLLLLPMIYSPYYEASQQFRLSAASILQNDDHIHQANEYRLLSGNQKIDKLFFHKDLLMVKDLASNYSDHLSLQFIFLSGDANLRHGTTEYGLFAFILIVPFFIGLYALFRHNKTMLFLLIVWWMISLLPASVPVDTPHALRSLNALLPLSLIIGFGATYLLAWTSLWRKVLTIGFGVIFLFEVASFWNFYLHEYPLLSASSWQNGYKQVSEKIYFESKKNDVLVTMSDKRVYLWLFAYSFYTSSEIQTFPKKNFELDKIDTISFSYLDGQTIQAADKAVTVIGPAEELEQQIREKKLFPESTEYVRDSFDRPVFLLARFPAAPKTVGKK